MEDLLEWLTPIARWVHVFAAILWIGQTYLFNWFEKNLEVDPKTGDRNIVGNLWMVHGGGFYTVEKQRHPEIMPKTLHWFKWEAATTWISGVFLLAFTYYMQGGGALMVEDNQNKHLAFAIGIGLVLVGWVVYDLIVMSPLGKNDIAVGVIAFFALVGISYGLPQFMSTRAAYIHVGFLVGTIMAANVWMRILPAQRRMLAAAKEGKRPDEKVSARGPQRSKHNSFMAIPLVFIMISNHYPTISYGNKYSWLILAVVLLAGWTTARILRGTRAEDRRAAKAPETSAAPKEG
jgi:uncharacterized membrane protein